MYITLLQESQLSESTDNLSGGPGYLYFPNITRALF